MLEYNKGKCADKAERSRVMVIRTQYLERLRPFYDSELVKVIYRHHDVAVNLLFCVRLLLK